MSTQSAIRHPGGDFSYEQLQREFRELQLLARDTAGWEQTASIIDQAIRRIEEEGSRDSDELNRHEQQYDQFKQQQSGMIGWLKRHLPFTQTRRLELAHRANLADGNAEILADRLFVARAQLLKQRLLPASCRIVGALPREWRDRLDRCQSESDWELLAQAARELISELEPCDAFYQQQKRVIDAFSEASFQNPNDQQLMKEDLGAARSELDAVLQEIREKQQLKLSVLTRLSELARLRARQTRPRFAELESEIGKLETERNEVDGIVQDIHQLTRMFQELHELFNRLHALPAQRESINKAFAELEQERAEISRQQTADEAELEQIKKRFDQARSESERTQGALDAARHMVEAYRKEQAGLAEADPALFNTPSPVEQQVHATQSEHDRAQKALAEITNTRQQSNSRLESTRRRAADCAARIDRQRRELDTLNDSERTLQNELGMTAESAQHQLDKTRGTVDRFQPQMSLPAQPSSATHWSTIRVPDLRRSPVPYDQGLPYPGRGHSHRELLESSRRSAQQLLDTWQQFQEAVGRLLDSRFDEREMIWREFCDDLYGSSLAREVLSISKNALK